MKVNRILTVLLVILNFNVYAQDILVKNNIHYRSAINIWDNSYQDLYFDLYSPKNESDTLRPLVIMVYGGAFVIGKSSKDDMVLFCNRFAKEGYVAASINYRLMPLKKVTYSNMLRSGYMAAQDLSYAIRYFKTHWQEYKIDTNKIAVLGSSAGAVAIFYNLFMTEVQRPIETIEPINLGQIHGSDKNLADNVSSTINCAVCFWGCVMDTNMIDSKDSKDTKTPLCLVHGEKDEILPIDAGYGFKLHGMPYVFGSRIIARRLQSEGLPYELHVFDDENHAFYYDVLFMYKLNMVKFNNCYDIASDFIKRNFSK